MLMRAVRSPTSSTVLVCLITSWASSAARSRSALGGLSCPLVAIPLLSKAMLIFKRRPPSRYGLRHVTQDVVPALIEGWHRRLDRFRRNVIDRRRPGCLWGCHGRPGALHHRTGPASPVQLVF